jgi:sarcosine oxidase
VGAAPDLVFDLIDRHGIACDAVRRGWLQLATSEAALGPIAARVRQWQRRGAAVELLDRGTAARLTGSTRYAGGWIDRRAGNIQPLSYLRGLARAVLRAGGRIHAQSEVRHLRRHGGAWTVCTAGGEIRCDEVLLATNAYTGRLVDRLRRSIVAVPSFQIASAPLPAAVGASILPERQAVSDTWQLLRYFRRDAAGRLVMGARGTFGAAPLGTIAAPHYRAVREIYPQLHDVAFEFHWGGLVAMTTDHLPHVHELAPGLRTALGYNGRGIAMATVMGRVLARWVLGESPQTCGLPPSPLRSIPLHGLSRWGARLAIQYLRTLDAVEGARDARRSDRRRLNAV